ncbi:MAG: histidinol dehydrogenase, partial [Chloroflexi bacterium]|nr:histidinol dehydrogenase [Chloroflexota bacterium]
MKIIEGFKSAKEILSRQVPAELYPVSPALRQSLKEIFGVDEPEAAVRQIIDEVRNRGDAALLDYTLKIDGVALTSLEVTREQRGSAYRMVAPELVSALKLAAGRIRSFHTAQKDAFSGAVAEPGLSQLTRPLQRVGLYVPGGTASYPSTVLMTAIPARVAGVKEIILVTPPRLNGGV